MIYIDERIGSHELADLIEEAIQVQLEFGDAMFFGNGPSGQVQIGIERKKIGDLVSSMMSGRLSGHQLPGLLESYYKVYLIVEGLWRADQRGELEVNTFRDKWGHLDRGRRKFAYRDIWQYLYTLQVMCGVYVICTRHGLETARQIEYLFHWWNKPWEKHHGHLAFRLNVPPAAHLRKPSLLMEIAADLPGLGWERAKAVDKAFGSVRKMFEANQKEWREVEGIGPITAKKVWEELHYE